MKRDLPDAVKHYLQIVSSVQMSFQSVDPSYCRKGSSVISGFLQPHT